MIVDIVFHVKVVACLILFFASCSEGYLRPHLLKHVKPTEKFIQLSHTELFLASTTNASPFPLKTLGMKH